MVINFYPDSDAQGLAEAVEEYKKLWEKEGNKIVAEIEKISGLKFTRKFLSAIIWLEEYGWSFPLSFSYSTPPEQREMEITHELCHRLVIQNKIETKTFTVEETHKQIFLILYDIFLNLWGEKKTKNRIEYEIGLWAKTGKKGQSPYKRAWDWALSMTKEQRAEEFKKYLK
ncbi:MAG: hypothetical protein A3B38_01030 [Candidatus Levybacteria bacterium RIFCSPLOWO2_01_FULL_36_13]|nr:MAG: hypothetical protein A2684_02270 [Candidatus Levybacteria bacterium RIFCSPHIGHO2_01_FULL_36_15b]OGH35470.1 MAG: hypothetical protein A3B38_01030 [Candidatus Levybacteria bacterium RIFCSPLOWO2_01_FULL_36_13]